MTFLIIKGTSGGLLSCRYCALFNSQTSLTMVFVGAVWLGCMHNVAYWNESSLHALSECILILLMVRISLLDSVHPEQDLGASSVISSSINQCHNLHSVPTTYARFSSPHGVLTWMLHLKKNRALHYLLRHSSSWKVGYPYFLYFLNNVDHHKLPRVFTTTGHGPWPCPEPARYHITIN